MRLIQLVRSLVIILLVASLAGPASGATNPHLPTLAQAVPAWQQVNSNGFGDPGAGEVSALGAYNGYLYAGTFNPIDPAPLYDGAQIFRSSDGLTWNPVTQPGFGDTHDVAPPAILDFIVFNTYLYASTGRGNAARIYRSLNGVNWAPVVNAGFNDPDNTNITALAAYNGKIYAGVSNAVTGAHIWSSFNGDSNSWTQATTPSLVEAGITGFANFDGGLYAAVQSQGAAQIWSSYGGAWTAAVSDGFGDSNTTLTGGMAVFGGDLYVGAGSTAAGAQLWRTSDGVHWTQAITPGFGDANNLKVELVFVFQNQLYASVQNTTTGLEVWRTPDGVQWEQANLDGFGDSHNSATNGSNAVENFGSRLYIGTVNSNDGGELWRMLLPYSVQLSPDQALSGPLGGSIIYTLGITNTGSLADSYDLIAAGQTWTTALSKASVSLAPSASAVFTATVAIPPGAADQSTDAVTITATSQGDGSQSDSAVLTTTAIAAPTYGVVLSPDASLSGPAGGQVSYTLAITNTGNVADTFDLFISGNNWTTTASSSSVTLAAGSRKEVTINVSIPITAVALASDQAYIQATSRHDPSQQDSALLTSISLGKIARIYLPAVMQSAP